MYKIIGFKNELMSGLSRRGLKCGMMRFFPFDQWLALVDQRTHLAIFFDHLGDVVEHIVVF